MDTYEIQASQTIKADLELIYRVLSDYRNEHPRILPNPYFASAEVEQGGVGAGNRKKSNESHGQGERSPAVCDGAESGERTSRGRTRCRNQDHISAGTLPGFYLLAGEHQNRLAKEKGNWRFYEAIACSADRTFHIYIYQRELDILKTYCEEKQQKQTN